MYGLIIIGDDLSSLVAAATASAQGIATALISETGMGANISVGDLSFNADPTPFTGISDNKFLVSFFNELGILPKTASLNPAYQVILPEKRIDFFNDKDDLTKELIREFPELANEIKAYYDALEINSVITEDWLARHPGIQPKSFSDFLDFLKLTPYLIKRVSERLKFKKIVSQYPCFQKAMEAQQALLSFQLNAKDCLFSDFIYGTALRGVYTFPDGKYIFFNDLIRKLEAAGGLYLKNHEILSVKKGRIIEVAYKDANGIAAKMESEKLIVSDKWQNMHHIMDRGRKFHWSDFFRPAQIAYYPFTIHLGITPQCLPEKMARHIAVVSDVGRDLYDDNNLILLESGVAQNTGAADTSQIPLSATVFLPDHSDVWSENNLAKRGDAIIDHLDDFLPFLRENIKFFDIQESISISHKQRSVVNPKYRIRNALLSGFAAKTNKTRFSNIYLTGASRLADAGFAGEILSGINAVRQLSEQRK